MGRSTRHTCFGPDSGHRKLVETTLEPRHCRRATLDGRGTLRLGECLPRVEATGPACVKTPSLGRCDYALADRRLLRIGLHPDGQLGLSGRVEVGEAEDEIRGLAARGNCVAGVPLELAEDQLGDLVASAPNPFGPTLLAEFVDLGQDPSCLLEQAVGIEKARCLSCRYRFARL